MKCRDVLVGRQWMGRLVKGDDLLESLTELMRKNQVRLGVVRGIGAIQKGRIAIYDQKEKKYTELAIDHPVEITHLEGNVSIKDGEIFCHLHATLCGEDGRATGGHVCKGCQVFAFEYTVQEYLGEDFVRTPDEETGLSLWNL